MIGEIQRSQADDCPLSTAEKRAIAHRVAASRLFQKSPRLREFLLYICDRGLKNQREELREHQIGAAVFGRPADYSPGDDNIVRVEARMLRKRLAEYYSTEGKQERWVIEIPKGSYMPVFVGREPGAGAAPAEPARAAQAEAPAAPVRRRALPWIVLAVLALLGALALLRYGTSANQTSIAAHFPWTALFDDAHPTNIVVADSCLVLLQDATHQRITLAEYLSHSYVAKLTAAQAQPELRALLEVIASRQYTSLADVNFVRRVMQTAPASRDRIKVTYSRNFDIRDFKGSHTILVGSALSTPWVELFEPKLNFRFQLNEQTKEPVFRNLSPRPGEQSEYTTDRRGMTGESYAVVALLPNLDHTGNVLIIEGTTMEGTEAGWEFLAAPDFTAKTLPRMGLNPRERTQYFEMLLRLRTVGGTSQDPQMLAWRIIR